MKKEFAMQALFLWTEMSRHRFTTHLLEQGTDILSMRELPSHKDIKANLLDTPISNSLMKKL